VLPDPLPPVPVAPLPVEPVPVDPLPVEPLPVEPPPEPSLEPPLPLEPDPVPLSPLPDPDPVPVSPEPTLRVPTLPIRVPPSELQALSDTMKRAAEESSPTVDLILRMSLTFHPVLTMDSQNDDDFEKVSKRIDLFALLVSNILLDVSPIGVKITVKYANDSSPGRVVLSIFLKI
jgi:hypothetical protein